MPRASTSLDSGDQFLTRFGAFTCRFGPFGGADAHGSVPLHGIEDVRFVDPDAPPCFHEQFTRRVLDPPRSQSIKGPAGSTLFRAESLRDIVRDDDDPQQWTNVLECRVVTRRCGPGRVH